MVKVDVSTLLAVLMSVIREKKGNVWPASVGVE